MWAFGRSRKTPAQSSPQAKGSNASPFDGVEGLSGLEGFDIPEPEISDGELDDPALLAELQKLAGGSKLKPKAMPKSKPQPVPDVDVNAILSSVPLEGDVHVEFRDEDMADPELLGMLKGLGGSTSDEEDLDKSQDGNDTHRTVDKIVDDGEHVEVPAKAIQQLRSIPQQQLAEPTASQVEPVDESLPISYRLRNTSPDLLQKYLHLQKIVAVNRKRSGDVEGAKEALKEVKLLEKRLTEVEEDIRDGRPVRDYVDSSAVRDELSRPPITDTIDAKGVVSEERQQGLLHELKQRQLEYKQYALQAKKVENLPLARYYLSVSKGMQEPIEVAEMGGDLDSLGSFTVPPHPREASLPEGVTLVVAQETATPKHVETPKKPDNATNATTAGTPSKKAKIVGVQAPDTPTVVTTSPEELLRAPVIHGDIHTHLTTTLSEQISLLTTISAHYLKTNQKPLALHYHKLKKTIQTDLTTLELLKANGKTPGFKYTTLKYEMEQANTDIMPDEMLVSIERGWDITCKGVSSSDLDLYVAFDFGDDSPFAETKESKGETPVVRMGADPVWEFEKKVKITRNKALQRYIERRKLILELYHSQRGFLFSKKVLIGKITMKLDELMGKCEVRQVLEVMDPTSPRRTTGARLSVRVALRTPLIKPHVVQKEDQWLVVDFEGAGSGAKIEIPNVDIDGAKVVGAEKERVQVPPKVEDVASDHLTVQTGLSPERASRTGTPSPQQPGKSPARSGATTPTPSPGHSASPGTPTPTSASSPGTSGADLDDLETEFNNPSALPSNAVLETEHAALVALISASHNGSPPPDLLDLKMQYELRLNTLVLLVQTGGLSMERYVQDLEDAIKKTKTYAVEFKKGGRIEMAKKALKRVKIMQGEVDEVKAALAEGG
ncbi:hypothetical protein BC832DRAFT_593754 [Gaertneriomyces semiglobifer]|nr:hypothetical protein BC832DRAFT_593754 [Gaertneriomyces semiglobifer]